MSVGDFLSEGIVISVVFVYGVGNVLAGCDGARERRSMILEEGFGDSKLESTMVPTVWGSVVRLGTVWEV